MSPPRAAPTLAARADRIDGEPGDAERVRLAATAFLRTRPLVLGPFFVAVALVLVFVGAPSRQLVALGIGASALMAVFLHERARAAGGPVSRALFGRSLVLTVVGIGVAASATGGLVSPLVPMVFAPLGIGFAAFGPSPEERRLLVVFVVVVLVGAVVTFAAPALALPHAAVAPVLALALVASATLLRVGVSSLTGAHVRAVEDRDRASTALAASTAARTRELELLGSRLAHEIKNPLTAVRALGEGMAARAEGRDKERLSVVLGEVARIQEIVEGVARLARPLDVVDLRRCDVGVVLTAVVATLEGRATRAEVTVGLTLPAEHARAFVVDPRRVHEAVQNLVLNAVEASPRGAHVEVELTGAPVCTVEVRDDGPGIDDATLARVGEPFVSNKRGGNGLGIAHAKRVAELHRGHLAIERRAEAGSGGGGTRAVLVLGDPRGDEGKKKERVEA